MGMDEQGIDDVDGRDVQSEQRDDAETPGAIESRTEIFVDGVPGEPLVDKVERTSLGLGGMTKVTQIRLRRADGCQHTLHTGADIGGTCGVCQRVLCAKCSSRPQNICKSCQRPTCGACQVIFSPGDATRAADSGEATLCRACSRRSLRRDLTVAGVVGLIVFLVVVLLLRL